MQPGEVFTPGGVPPTPPEDQQPVPPQAVEQPPFVPAPSPAPLPDAQQPAGPTPEQHTVDNSEAAEMSWTASEFINHEKSPAWYGALMVAGIAIGAVCFLLTKDPISSFMLVLIATAFGVLAARRPRTMDYGIYPNGIAVNQHFYDFREFRAFAVVDEGAVSSVTLLPLKRFALPLNLFCPPDLEEDVFNHIGDHLPFLENYNDPLDNLMRKLRF